MEENSALYIRAVFNNQKRWVKVNAESVDVTEAINRAIALRFEIPADKKILYYDEAHYQIDNDLLKDFIWFNPRGVILNIQLEGEELHSNSLPSTPSSNISVASTSTNFSGSSDVPRSLICERSLSPKPEGHIQMLSYSFNEQEFIKRFKAHTEGAAIVKEYNSIRELTIGTRKKLTNVTAAIIIEQYGNYPNKNIKLQCAKALVKLFPCFEDNEGRGYELFFNPDHRTGFLENRLRTINRSNAQEKKKLKSVTKESPQETHGEESDATDYGEYVEFLNNACVKTQKNEIFLYMKKTFNIRKSNCENILEEFPRFTDTPGLISQDFYLMYGYTGSFVTKLPQLLKKVYYVLRKERSKDLPTEWDNDTNGVIALVHLLPPSARGRKGCKKSNVTEAIDRLISYHHVFLPLSEGLNKPRTTQPYLLAVGSCKQVIVDYYIILDGVLIPCESKTALGAFDELFQSYFVFKTKFDDHLRSFWTYIQTEVYSLITNEHVTLTPREREIQIKINNVLVD